MGSETEEFGPAAIEDMQTPERAPMACGITTDTRFTVVLSTLAGEELAIAVTRNTPLRDLQEQVCRHFKKRWPETKAVLTLEQHTYDEFMQKPFMSCRGGEMLRVVFVRTDDPYSCWPNYDIMHSCHTSEGCTVLNDLHVCIFNFPILIFKITLNKTHLFTTFDRYHWRTGTSMTSETGGGFCQTQCRTSWSNSWHRHH